MAANTNQEVQLERCYLKDAARYRTLVDVVRPWRSIRSWREKLANLSQRGIDVYFVVVEGIDRGIVRAFNPIELPGWNIVLLSMSLSDTAKFAREVSRQLFQADCMLFRIDVYSSVCRIRQEREDDAEFIDECEDSSSPLLSRLEHSIYYSPELDDRQVAFIPWEFGYIAIVTNAKRDKIESVKFVRGHIEEYDVLIKKAALYGKIVDDEGLVVPYGRNEPIKHESDLLVKAREELAKYLQRGHIPDIEYEFPHGTPFQQRVWKETESIVFGSIATYSELAHRVEPDPVKAGRLARAVGQALSANPLPILIPCHRVIGANRDLTGFSGGVDIKEYLLQKELWKTEDSKSNG